MDIQHEEIKLKAEPVNPKPELPTFVKPIKIGERVFLFKWTFMGWKPLSEAEETDIRLRFGV
jgi:hypothetical protein